MITDQQALSGRLTEATRIDLSFFAESTLDLRGRHLKIGTSLAVGNNCNRLLPPLTLSHAEADIALERMDETCTVMLGTMTT
ncbi:hypothetical protein G4G27_16280 [Sphingomonas sp. So64.6b]|uniref:hypothetical protein n=1 Tax=Sphingomonas sp. So64.6b TaxID=2997354 RepID=UPI0016031D57|nr:hypothetical protein [Sphingomonas sp. So64.6b]QNA85381.1 hypothetical protein G4G27_16280 [Sphingomonas sp. So64.6b]